MGIIIIEISHKFYNKLKYYIFKEKINRKRKRKRS